MGEAELVIYEVDFLLAENHKLLSEVLLNHSDEIGRLTYEFC
jgi:hypothetical protein